MPDPIARLEFCRQEVDRVFGAGHAAANPELVSTIMLSAALDFAAIRLSAAIERSKAVRPSSSWTLRAAFKHSRARRRYSADLVMKPLPICTLRPPTGT